MPNVIIKFRRSLTLGHNLRGLCGAFLAGLLFVNLVPAAHGDAGDDQFAVAANHYVNQRWKLAAEEFQILLKKHPSHAKTNRTEFLIGEALIQLGKYDDARRHFESYLKTSSTGSYAKHARFRMGESAYLARQSNVANRELKQFLADHPNDDLLKYVLPYLGNIALSQNQPQPAQQFFEQAASLFPDGPMFEEGQFGLARSLEKQKKQKQAAAIYKELISKSSPDLAIDARFRLGIVQYTQDNFGSALETFRILEKLLVGEKSRGSLLLKSRYWQGIVLKKQGKFIAASVALQSAADTAKGHPLLPDIIYHAGDANLQAGRHQLAKQLFDRVLAKWPSNSWADDSLLGKIESSLKQENHSDVARLYAQFAKDFANSHLLTQAQLAQSRALMASQHSDEAVLLLGRVRKKEDLTKNERRDADLILSIAHRNRGNHERALNIQKTLLADSEPPAKYSLALEYATTLARLGRTTEATGELKKLLTQLTLPRDLGRCQSELAGCQLKQGNSEQARTHYEAGLRLFKDPRNRLAETLRLAETAYHEKQYDFARALFTKLTAEGNPARYQSEGISGLAWSQFVQGNMTDSAATFDELLKRYPNSSHAGEAVLMRGQSLEKLDKLEPALAMYLLVVEKYSKSDSLASAMISAARLHDRLQQDDQAVALYEKFNAKFSGHRRAVESMYHHGWALRELKHFKQADQLFDTIYKDHSESPFWADATYRHAEYQVEQKAYDDANKILVQLVKKKPDSTLAAHAMYLQSQIAVAGQDWNTVVHVLEDLTRQYPDSKLSLSAEYWLAEAAYRQNRFESAETAFEELSARARGRKDSWVAAVQLRRAQIMSQRKEWDNALRMAATIERDFPDFLLLYEVDYLLGRCYASRAEFNKARAAYLRVIHSNHGRKTEIAATAQWMIGETYFHQKKYKKAIREYDRVGPLYDYVHWQAASALQSGKCYEILGDWKEATRRYTHLIDTYSKSTFVDEAKRRLTVVQQRAVLNDGSLRTGSR